MGKIVQSSKFSEWKGLDRISPIVHEMPSIFREISKDDFGIDGEIEIVVPKLDGQGYQTKGGIIKVQSKSGKSYIRQDSEESFSTPIERNDLEYWHSSNVPVIFIVYHPDDDTLYWKDVKMYFKTTPNVFQAPLRILFNKMHDCFDETCYPALCELAAISPPSITAEQSEQIFSNLLLVKSSPTVVTCAHATHENAQEIRSQITGYIPPFCLSAGELYTFSDLRNPDCVLRRYCDVTTIRDVQVVSWLEQEQGKNDHTFLLNQLLSSHLRRCGLHYYKELHRYYFPRQDESSEEFKREWVNIRTGRTATRIIVKHYQYGKEHYWRHLAVQFTFRQFRQLLCLQILPKYLYTIDGRTLYDTTKVGAVTTRIKAVEHNTHVLNHILFWADVLSQGNSSIELQLDHRPATVIEKRPISSIAPFAILNDPAIYNEVEYTSQPTLFGPSEGVSDDLPYY